MVFKEPTFYGETPAIAEDHNQPLETAVADALAVAGGLDGSQITVTVAKGSIVLGGFVATVREAERAVEVATGVAGTTAIDNRIALG